MYFWKYFWMYFFVWKYFFLFGYITIALVTARCGFPCAKTDSLICGHDNKTYQGECVMRRESCWRREAIVKAYNGKCKTGTWIFWVESVEIQSFFWSVFSSNRTGYGNLLCKSPYSVQIQENMDEKKPYFFGHFLRSEYSVPSLRVSNWQKSSSIQKFWLISWSWNIQLPVIIESNGCGCGIFGVLVYFVHMVVVRWN